MKKWLFYIFSLCIIVRAFSAPSNSLNITPAAVDGTTITASDENSRNNEISTKYNAHSHTDFTGTTSNTLTVGDGAAGNKDIIFDNGDGNLPTIRFNDTSDFFSVADDGSNFYEVLQVAGTQSITGVKTFSNAVITGGSVSVPNVTGTTLTGTNTTTTTLVVGTANQGDIYYDDGTDFHRLIPGTSGKFLQTKGASANPVYANAYVDRDATTTDWTDASVKDEASAANDQWFGLDMTGKYTAGATAVVLNYEFQDNAAGSRFYIKEEGVDNVTDSCQISSQVSGVNVTGDCVVALAGTGAAPTLMYKSDADWDATAITIKGSIF